MLDDIVVHDIAQGISVPVSTTENRLLPPWARIACRFSAHPAGLALLISEQTFQEQACIRRNTLLREQRTYPFLDLSKRRRPQRKRLLNRRGPRPRHSNHGCPWIQKSANKATVMLRALIASLGQLGRVEEAQPLLHEFISRQPKDSQRHFEVTTPYLELKYREHLAEGLRRADVMNLR